MLGLSLPDGPVTVLSIGAHCDDIEIGCGATLLRLAARGDVSFFNLVMSGGSSSRRHEAVEAAELFFGSAPHELDIRDFPDGRLPAAWADVKQALEAYAKRVQPDLIFVPRADDAHQDHRLLGKLVSTVWRNALTLHYEIPKWDGDLSAMTHYVAVADDLAAMKVRLLNKAFPSQHGHDWWDDETFLGLMRLRGVECRSRYAEAFVAGKVLLSP